MYTFTTSLLLAIHAIQGTFAAPFPTSQTPSTSEASASIARIQPRSISNAVISPNFPDPSIIKVGNTWYAFATRTIGSGINVPMASSSDFNTWTQLTTSSGSTYDSLPQMPPWVNQSYPFGSNQWAPDVNQMADGSFVMYFSASVNSTRNNGDWTKHCVGVATSKTIQGPYTAQTNPLVCDLSKGGAIDASGYFETVTTRNIFGFSTTTRQNYLLWKVDGNSIGHGGTCGNTVSPTVSTGLYIQPISANGLTLSGSPTLLLDNRGASDDGVVEAPSLVKTAGANGASVYTLFFSSGCFSSPAYTVNYATSSSLLGPYTRASAPLMSTGTNGLTAPGGADVWSDGNHLVFHAGNLGNRKMYTALVSIGSNGTVTY